MPAGLGIKEFQEALPEHLVGRVTCNLTESLIDKQVAPLITEFDLETAVLDPVEDSLRSFLANAERPFQLLVRCDVARKKRYAARFPAPQGRQEDFHVKLSTVPMKRLCFNVFGHHRAVTGGK